MKTLPVTLIVAASQNNVIGKNNTLPWHLPRDLQYFKKITLGSPVIMGRKTYESIGKALPGRLNIVISHNPDYQLEDAKTTISLSSALAIAQQQVDAKAIHIIGGASIFSLALSESLIDKLYLSRILAEVEGDSFLPDIDWSQWQLKEKDYCPADKANNYNINFEVYEKVR